jgi:tetratricopeptide (TPR) repeat protein
VKVYHCIGGLGALPGCHGCCCSQLLWAAAAAADDDATDSSPARVLRLCIAHRPCIALFKQGKYSDAAEAYTAALEVDPENADANAKLLCNRGNCNLKMRQYLEAEEDCTAALGLDSKYAKAYALRGEARIELEMYEEALQDYDVATDLDQSPAYMSGFKKAKLELKKSKRKNYYKILAVDKNADERGT